MRKLLAVQLATMLAMAATACTDTPLEMAEDEGFAEIVVTHGAPLPPQGQSDPGVPSLSTVAVDALVTGSSTSPVSVNGDQCTEFPSRQISVTYRISGQQPANESFKVYGTWTYDGDNFVGSDAVTVQSPARTASSAATERVVQITIINGAETGSGNESFVIHPFDNTSNGNPNINFTGGNPGTVAVHVAFDACSSPNTPPNLTLPDDIVGEATSSSGAVVNYTVTASDQQDGDLTGAAVCTPASGSTFPLGETTVNCSVQDSGGLTAEGSFKITIVDTTPPDFTTFPGNQLLIAADVNGAVLDISLLAIEAEDLVSQSADIDISCAYLPLVGQVDNAPLSTPVAIGQTRTVSCTATDEAGNTSSAQYFDVTVTLDFDDSLAFLPPLRMLAPYSAHKLNSAIPHKLAAPRYADGSPAADLAAGLRLVLKKESNNIASVTEIVGEDHPTGSTAWRYDPVEEHYIFNLKTGNKSPWSEGTWETQVEYQGIVLAKTLLTLRK